MTTIKLQDENGTTTDAIGLVDCGGFIVPRAELEQTLPDFARFERSLPQTIATEAYMRTHDGTVPPAFEALSRDEQRDIAITMQELAVLAAFAADKLDDELEGRRHDRAH